MNALRVGENPSEAVVGNSVPSDGPKLKIVRWDQAVDVWQAVVAKLNLEGDTGNKDDMVAALRVSHSPQPFQRTV